MRLIALLSFIAVLGIRGGVAQVLPEPPAGGPASGGPVREIIEVHADSTESRLDGSSSGIHLNLQDLQDRSSTVVNDPLRTIQLLPGVTANDDLTSGFAARGAESYRIGIYLDGILLRSPFHKTEEGPGQASLSVVPGDLLGGASFYAGNAPPRFSDTSGGALDLETRDDSPSERRTTINLGSIEAGFVTGGPFGADRRGSYLFTVRQSYVNYIVRAISDDPSALFGYRDFDGKIRYDLSPAQRLTLLIMEGDSGLNLGNASSAAGDPAKTAYRSTLASLAWQYAPNSHWMATSRVAQLSDSVRNIDGVGNPMVQSRSNEWVFREDVAVAVRPRNTLEFGASFHTDRMIGSPNGQVTSPSPNLNRASTVSGYFHDSISLMGGRGSLEGGARWDEFSKARGAVSSVYTSAAVRTWRSGTVHAGWSEYAQLPDLDRIAALELANLIRPERSIQFDVGVVQAVAPRTRVRLDVYRRLDRDLLPDESIPAQPSIVSVVPAGTRFGGTARGLEFSMESRFAKLVISTSYALGFSTFRGPDGSQFPSDADQRHTTSAYAQYELSRKLHFSAKWRYGSGLPIPGPFRFGDGGIRIGSDQNQLRMEPYSRLDLRADRSWQLRKGQLTLHFEVWNALNRRNLRYEGALIDPVQAGRVNLQLGRMLPLLPLAGLSFSF